MGDVVRPGEGDLIGAALVGDAGGKAEIEAFPGAVPGKGLPCRRKCVRQGALRRGVLRGYQPAALIPDPDAARQQKQGQHPAQSLPQPKPGRDTGGRRDGRFRRSGSRRRVAGGLPPAQRIQRQVQRVRQGQQLGKVWRGLAGLPLAHRLPGDAQPGGQLLLTQSPGLPLPGEIFGKLHGVAPSRLCLHHTRAGRLRATSRGWNDRNQG